MYRHTADRGRAALQRAEAAPTDAAAAAAVTRQVVSLHFARPFFRPPGQPPPEVGLRPLCATALMLRLSQLRAQYDANTYRYYDATHNTMLREESSANRFSLWASCDACLNPVLRSMQVVVPRPASARPVSRPEPQHQLPPDSVFLPRATDNDSEDVIDTPTGAWADGRAVPCGGHR